MFFQNRNFWVTAFKVFYTLIDYLKSLRLTTSPIRQIKLNPNAVVLEEFIPVLANALDLAFAGLASSGFSDSWVTAGVCPKSTFWVAEAPPTDPRFWLGFTISPAVPPWPLPGAVPSTWGWGSEVTGSVYSGTSFTAERFWVNRSNAFSKSANLSFNPLI